MNVFNIIFICFILFLIYNLRHLTLKNLFNFLWLIQGNHVMIFIYKIGWKCFNVLLFVDQFLHLLVVYNMCFVDVCVSWFCNYLYINLNEMEFLFGIVLWGVSYILGCFFFFFLATTVVCICWISFWVCCCVCQVNCTVFFMIMFFIWFPSCLFSLLQPYCIAYEFSLFYMYMYHPVFGVYIFL